MRKTISPDELPDAIATHIADRIKDEIDGSEVIGSGLSVEIHQDSKGVRVKVGGPNAPKSVDAELHRIMRKVLGEIGTPKD